MAELYKECRHHPSNSTLPAIESCAEPQPTLPVDIGEGSLPAQLTDQAEEDQEKKEGDVGGTVELPYKRELSSSSRHITNIKKEASREARGDGELIEPDTRALQHRGLSVYHFNVWLSNSAGQS